MKEAVEGISNTKDAVIFGMIGSGGAVAKLPYDTAEIIGWIIAGLGILLGFLRMYLGFLNYKQSKRAHELNERKLEHDIAKSKHVPTSNRRQKDEEPDLSNGRNE